MSQPDRILALKREALQHHRMATVLEADDQAYSKGYGAIVDQEKRAQHACVNQLKGLGVDLPAGWFLSDEADDIHNGRA